MAKNKLLMLVVVVMLSATNMHGAGVCMPLTVEDAVKRSSAIFAGTVLEVSKRKLDGRDCAIVLKMRVERVWKGAKTKGVEVIVERDEEGDEDYFIDQLTKGNEWLIYAEGNPYLFTSHRTRTKQLKK